MGPSNLIRELSMDTIDLKVNYKIIDNKLNTEIEYPQNFLDLPDSQKVSLLSGLIDYFNAEAIPEELVEHLLPLKEAHSSLVQESAVLFPFYTTISMDLSESDPDAVSVILTHEEKIGSLHKMDQMVLIDGIVTVLKAMAIMIVNKPEVTEAY